MDFYINKDIIYWPAGYSHICYDSITDGHNRFWESKNALNNAKMYAKQHGFSRLIIVAKTCKSKDKIYTL